MSWYPLKSPGLAAVLILSTFVSIANSTSFLDNPVISQHILDVILETQDTSRDQILQRAKLNAQNHQSIESAIISAINSELKSNLLITEGVSVKINSASIDNLLLNSLRPLIESRFSPQHQVIPRLIESSIENRLRKSHLHEVAKNRNKRDLFGDIFGAVGGAVNGVANAVGGVAQGVGDAVGGVVNGVGNVVGGVVNGVGSVVSGGGDGSGSLLGDLGNAVGNTVNGVVTGVGNAVNGVVTDVGNTVGGVVTGVGNTVNSGIDSIVDSAINAALQSALRSLFKTVNETLTSFVLSIVQVLDSIVGNLIDLSGITNSLLLIIDSLFPVN